MSTQPEGGEDFNPEETEVERQQRLAREAEQAAAEDQEGK